MHNFWVLYDCKPPTKSKSDVFLLSESCTVTTRIWLVVLTSLKIWVNGKDYPLYYYYLLLWNVKFMFETTNQRMVISSKWTINIGNWRIGKHIPNYPGLPWATCEAIMLGSHRCSTSVWKGLPGISNRPHVMVNNSGIYLGIDGYIVIFCTWIWSLSDFWTHSHRIPQWWPFISYKY